jgi:hypothetical protein
MKDLGEGLNVIVRIMSCSFPFISSGISPADNVLVIQLPVLEIHIIRYKLILPPLRSQIAMF